MASNGPPSTSTSADTQQRLTPESLAAARGLTPRWWRRRLPRMLADGAVVKHGRFIFGSLATVDAWIRGDRTVEHEIADTDVAGLIGAADAVLKRFDDLAEQRPALAAALEKARAVFGDALAEVMRGGS